jgi:hypothetical protein
MNLKWWVIAFGVALFGLHAHAQPSCTNGGTIAVSFSPSGTGSSCSITSAGSGKYNVDIYRGTGQTTVVAKITGTSSDRLHLVRVHNSTAYITWLYVGTAANPFDTIDSVSSDTTSGTLVLVDLHTASHLGQNGVSDPMAIDVEQISDVWVGGDVLSPITARTSNINSLNVTGGSTRTSPLPTARSARSTAAAT